MIGQNQYGKGIEQMYRIEEREGKRGVLKPLMVWNCQKDPLQEFPFGAGIGWVSRFRTFRMKKDWLFL